MFKTHAQCKRLFHLSETKKSLTITFERRFSGIESLNIFIFPPIKSVTRKTFVGLVLPLFLLRLLQNILNFVTADLQLTMINYIA